VKYNQYNCLDASDVAWLKENCHLLPKMSAGKDSNLTYVSDDRIIDSVSSRSNSDVYVSGSFEIAIVNTREAIGGPAFPHVQWIHGPSLKSLSNALRS
jgi:hypothetical protein